VVERAMLMSHGDLLDGAVLPPAASRAAPASSAVDATLDEVERAHIRRVLERARWIIEGERGAARILGLNPSTLRGRMRKLGIRKTS
jgi:transcriptional regulator with GAF, ATPase, and Fis domain